MAKSMLDAAQQEIARLRAEVRDYQLARDYGDEQKARAEQAERELDEAMREFTRMNEALGHAIVAKAQAEAELVRLRAALEKYGQHEEGCLAEVLYPREGGHCRCGLDAASKPPTDVCVCGHSADEHGNDGTGHCGATKACRSDAGCKQFRSQETR